MAESTVAGKGGLAWAQGGARPSPQDDGPHRRRITPALREDSPRLRFLHLVSFLFFLLGQKAPEVILGLLTVTV